MTRSLLVFLLIIAVAYSLVGIAAWPISVHVSNTDTITSELIVADFPPRIVLEVRYPNGGFTLYEGDRIPASLSIDVGSSVELWLFTRVKEPGVYVVGARVESLSPDSVPNEDDIPAGSVAGRRSEGELSSAAMISTPDYYIEGLAIRLEVYFRASPENGPSSEVRKTVVVRLRPPPSNTRSSSQSVSMTQFTFVPPGNTSTRSTSRSYSPGTVKWITSTTEVRGLSISPPSQEVDAGDVASFDVCPSIDSPKFRVEKLPVGYRYIFSKSGDCYKLKIFTHPLSFGTFDMEVVAYQAGVEERSPISLTVRKTATSTRSQTSASSQQTTAKPTWESEASSTTMPESAQSISTKSAQITNVVITQTVTEEPYPLTWAMGGVAAMLGLILILLLLRRRS